MKIAPGRIDGVLGKPDVAVLLLYGEDAGLVHFRATRAIAAAMPDTASPFQLSTLLREEHGRLRDEALTTPLDGTRRVVRVMEAGDALVPVLMKLLQGGCGALVVLEAGPLLPRSKLRSTAEKEASWAAIACYALNSTAIAAEIKNVFGELGLSVAEEAMQYLVSALVGDSAQRRRELDKLALYAAGTGRVEISDAIACCVGGGEAALSDAFTAAMLGDVVAVDKQIAAAEWEGTTGPGLLAGFSLHIHRLLRIRAAMDSGLSGEAAGRAQRPPLYPRQLESMLRQVSRWRAKELLQLLGAVSTADAACKRAGTRDVAIASKVILDTTRYASRRSGST